MIKKIVKIIVCSIALIILNGLFYLFYYQYKTVAKIKNGESINVYETLSILSLHSGICTLGSFYCPDAASAHLKMLTTNEDTVYMHTNSWFTPKIKERFKTNKLGKMAWNGNIDYSSNEKDAAILLNYCYLDIQIINGKECYTATCPYNWSKPSKTQFKLGILTITIYEELFHELEKKNILHPYTLVCYYEKVN